MRDRVILLRAAAPPKPVPGAACNGCGLCCVAQPCPLGMLVSRRRQGRCRALQWQAGEARYACGVLVRPGRWLPWLPATLARRLVARWIAAARGCDSTLVAG
jgi:Fe-S-cluster-containing hydrogenase component 2